jgi:hypothetical protein
VRSVLDDVNWKDNEIVAVRPKCSQNIKNQAVQFAISQLHKDYGLDAVRNTSPNTTDWYCSELVWAAYKIQGINIVEDNITKLFDSWSSHKVLHALIIAVEELCNIIKVPAYYNIVDVLFYGFGGVSPREIIACQNNEISLK